MGFFNKILGGLQGDSTKSTNSPTDTPKSANSTMTRNTNACPSCGTVLDKTPKRKIKCPDCDSEIYVRTTQNIFPSDLLTKEDALAADFFRELGAEIEDYESMKEKLRAKWGTEPKSYDIVWGLSNWLLSIPVDSDVYDKDAEIMSRGKMIAFNQALYQLKRGKDPRPYQENSNNYEIKLATLRGFNKICILAQCCDACDKHDGEVHNAVELIKNPVLPYKECTRKLEKDDKYSWCTCMYLVEPNYSSS